MHYDHASVTKINNMRHMWRKTLSQIWVSVVLPTEKSCSSLYHCLNPVNFKLL